MKTLFTLLLSITIAALSVGQSCWSGVSDTTVCGYTLRLSTVDVTDFEVICPSDGFIHIDTQADSTVITFSQCGDYHIICCTDGGGCLDTLGVTVYDNSSVDINENLETSLSYEDIDCPFGVVADCGSTEVSITLGNDGPPTPVWTFDGMTTCSATLVSTLVGDIQDGCQVASIDVVSFTDGATDTAQTKLLQDYFIELADDSTVLNNDILMIIDSLLGQPGSCSAPNNSCPGPSVEDCRDSLVTDTVTYYVPVHLGGKWTLTDLPALDLQDSTVFNYLGNTYELIIRPGVYFFGPGTLDLEVNAVTLVAGVIQNRTIPYSLNLQMQWQEEWTYDTIAEYRDRWIDIDGDCIDCGGTKYSRSFNIPEIPDLPCGPVGISFPDECECEFNYPAYDIQLTNCQPKEWQLEVYSDHYILDLFGVEVLDNSGNVATFTTQDGVLDGIISDFNGCIYDISEFISYGYEEVEIALSQSELSCLTPTLTVEATAIGRNGNVVPFTDEPEWQTPIGSMWGSTISVSEPGLYTVSAVDEWGCEYTNNISINYNSNVEVISELGTACAGNTYEFMGSTYPPGNYLIDVNCMTQIEMQVAEISPNVFFEEVNICAGQTYARQGTTYPAGSYVIQVDSISPCPDIVELTVVEQSPSSVTVSNSLTCTDSIAVLSTTAAPGSTYMWESAAGFINDDSTIAVVDPGIYMVTITSILAPGESCEEVHAVTVEQTDNTPSLSVPQIVTSNCSPITSIDFIETDAATLTISNQQGEAVLPSITSALSEGMYSVVATSSDGCTATEQFNVVEVDPLEVDYEVVDACEGEDNGGIRNLQIQNGLPPYEISINQEEVSEEHHATLESGSYDLVITERDGCQTTQTVAIEESPSLPTIEDQYIESCIDAEVTITLPSDEGYTYAWADGHVGNTRLAVKGRFDVIISTPCDEEIITYIVEASTEGTPFTLPNVINPNGFEDNRTFLPVQRRIVTDYSLRVFDRLGSEVFASTSPEYGWDGTYRGRPVSMGNYVYMITATVDDCSAGPEAYTKNGSLLVLR